MSQNDYKERVEAHRQSIQLESNGTSEKPTRMSRKQKREERGSGKPPKKGKNNSLLTVLAVIFVMIPASILIYTFFIKSDTPSTKDTPKATASDHVEIETNQNDTAKKEPENKTTDSAAKANEATKAEKEKQAEQLAKEKQAKKAEQERLAKEKAEQEKAAAEKKKEEEKKKPVENVKPSAAYTSAIQSGYLHNAVEGDTIQSISIKYYGSEAYVSQIKQLNGITADRVPAGTKVALIKTQ